MANQKQIIEFGDFQTPADLAREVISVIDTKIKNYETIIEPTCGLGTFLQACLTHGIESSKLIGWEINPDYVNLANESLRSHTESSENIVRQQDFFDIDWHESNTHKRKATLFIGNPPWVTNSELGKLYSKNLPEKHNLNGLTGLDAMTGKSNFDISEWMVMKMLDFISGTNSSIAFLVKTSVARKLFHYSASRGLSVSNFFIREIDAKHHFGVSVDACLFGADGTVKIPKSYICSLYDSLSSRRARKKMGITDGKLIANIRTFQALAYIDIGSEFKWRSGVKHDASKVMEFDINEGELTNGLGETVELSHDFLFPMYKSSHIAKDTVAPPKKYMLVTQRKIGDDTAQIKSISSSTWKYLEEHSDKLDARKSSIYKNAPRFSMFGVGDYSFAPWKVVISGLYKNLIFSKIGQYGDKPILVDDTCYMLEFESEEQAEFVLKILTSEVCKNFIDSIIFKDNKRPITVSLLNRINIRAIAIELDLEPEYHELFSTTTSQLALL